MEGHLARALARLTPHRVTEGRGLGALLPPEPGSLASAIDEDVAARHEARERVRAYVTQRAEDRKRVPDAFEVIDRAYPPGGAGVDAIPLLLSDLQRLIEEPEHG